MQITNSIISQSPNTSPITQNIAWYQEPITIFTFIIATVIVNLFTVYKSWSELRNQQRLFIEGQNLKERDDIRYKLNHFFGPIKELRGESRILYDVFALKEKAEFKEKKSYFRTVTYLTDGHSFSDQDEALLDEIIAIGMKQIELIEKEGWAVTNLHLTEILGQLGAHIRILRMAHENKLEGMTDGIKELVFPLEIDGALESETRKLKDRYAGLLGNSSNGMNSEKLDENQRKTIEYYNKNSLRYYKEAAFIDMSEFIKDLENKYRVVP